MEFDWLQTACNAIILVGGVVVAVKNISEWFGKPITFLKKKSDVDFEKKVTAIVKKILPDILCNHDLETREKYKADREAYLQDIKKEVLNSIQGQLGSVDKLEEQYEALVISAKDVLREKIMAIYHKNKKDRTLTFHEKEALDQYYKDYKAINGNSYIDKYYKRMCTWTVVDTDDYEDMV